MGALAEGVYEALRTVALDRELESADGVVPDLQPVDREAAADVLARHIATLVRRAVEAEPDTGRRVALVNKITEHLNADDDALPGTIEQLLELSSADPVAGRTWPRPVTPLSDAALLTNSPGEPALSAELRAELASADRVDLLCAFIRWHGLGVLVVSPIPGIRSLASTAIILRRLCERVSRNAVGRSPIFSRWGVPPDYSRRTRTRSSPRSAPTSDDQLPARVRTGRRP
ncbi:hypothetical protein [Phytoactinopolyspora mesophila]|uniref:Uncharacterized protein n=1 Tax=Phytoactinopolyspora mesophila TaxID=2650750 RepID=A0A7K3MB65_9ACTN|nr:hypothetical protein [Phytoactinopolyspora mesophila]NDL60400.1 hypothetical protein [Phytoactinopolyspora mesophila]